MALNGTLMEVQCRGRAGHTGVIITTGKGVTTGGYAKV